MYSIVRMSILGVELFESDQGFPFENGRDTVLAEMEKNIELCQEHLSNMD